MPHYIRDLEDELAGLIDGLDPEVGAAKTKEWYAWQDRLMNFVVKKVLESYHNGREGITDTAEAGTAAGHNKAPAAALVNTSLTSVRTEADRIQRRQQHRSVVWLDSSPRTVEGHHRHCPRVSWMKRLTFLPLML
jgi:hypothetical protein